MDSQQRIEAMQTPALLEEITMLQNIQKQNAQVSMEWRHASRQLAPRFEEMARRDA